MKIVALAVALFVMQAAPPVPRQAPDSGAGASQAIQNHAKSNEKPAKPPSPIVQTVSAAPDQSPNAANSHNKDEKPVEIGKLPPVSISRDAIDYLGLGLTFVLLIVGFLGVRAAYRTLRAIEGQLTEMKAQRATMQRQLWTMQGQLAEMKSAGAQTDEMIAQVTEQVGHLETSATAAKDSADILVMSERAWVQVHIPKPPEVQITTRVKDGGLGPIERVWVRPDVINVGRTPAKMTKIIIVTCEILKPLGTQGQMPPGLPEQPKYEADEHRRAIGIERDMMLAPSTGITPLPIEIKGQEWERITSRKSTLYLYGFIDYMDVVNKPHQTRFCEVYWVPASASDPNPPGFITAGNTPPAYTDSD